MFEKLFAKYARAVSDERERAWLYGKYRTKTVVNAIFIALCVAFFVLAVVLNPYIEQDWVLLLMMALMFGWIGFGIASLCLLVSFKRTYRAILNRPAYEGEMPEVASYRQKVAADRKSTIKKMWWAWLIFGICAALFIALITVDTIKNPDGEEMGVYGSVGTLLLLAGALTLFFAYFISAVLKQQKGKAIEQQTATEAEAIDRAQGRETRYDPQADVNIQVEKMFEYLFPNEELRERAHAERKRRTKIITPTVVILGIAAIAAIFIFARFDLFGYAIPAVYTLLFGGTALISVCTGGKLKAIEKEQKAELDSRSEYAKNLEWYRLYDNFYKFKGKIIYICLAAGTALGWALAIPFPPSSWPLISIVPVVVGIIVNSKLVNDLRKKALPIEKQIDEQRAMSNDRDGAESDKDDIET